MTQTNKSAPVAYLAPELPALSATFVYEEVHALERRGVRVATFAVHRPSNPAPGQEAMAARTQVLYAGSSVGLALASLAAVPRFGARAFRAASWLVHDMVVVGIWRFAAWKLAYQFLAGARLAAWLQARKCSHLHVHFAHVPAQIGMYASAFAGIPFSVVAHANDIFERGLLLREKARRAVKMFAISEYNRAHLRALGVPDEQIEVVRCGVALAERVGLPTFEQRPQMRVGTLGRLVEKKGMDDLLRALAVLPASAWSVQLSIAGDGPMGAELEALAGQLGLQERVCFEGALAHQDVAAWLRSLDVFALACKPDSNGDMDGIPVVLMEAMSQQVPVLSTRLSGIPELIVHDETGLLAEPATPASLADQLHRLLEAPELRRRLAGAAVRLVETEFGQEVNIDRLMKHLPHIWNAGFGSGNDCPRP